MGLKLSIQGIRKLHIERLGNLILKIWDYLSQLLSQIDGQMV